MARYIDAEKLEREMYHEAFETDSDMQKWDSGCWIRYKMFENCIAQQPTADVVEVVHGEWERIEKKDETRIINVDFRCSACRRFRFHNGELRRYKYCPNCGAKMNGEKVE